jgi:hypothetical protein
MIYLLALIPATALTIAGYFVLYLARRSEGGVRTFGRYLGFWAFTLAGLVILGAIFAAGHAHRGPHPMWGMHGRMHCPWSGGRYDQRLPGERPRDPPPPGALVPVAPRSPEGSAPAASAGPGTQPAH